MKFTLLRKSVPAWLLLVAIISAAASISIYVATNLKTTTSQPDFSLTANPNRETLLNGSDGPYWSTITVGAANNFTGIVSMAVSSPNGVNGRLIRVDAGSQIDISQVLLGRDQNLHDHNSHAVSVPGRILNSQLLHAVGQGSIWLVRICSLDPIHASRCRSGRTRRNRNTRRPDIVR